ncbi:hypothetical protein [Natronorarus salvus]|uniref:hypothetical protein n=1 Tax=Natronorarus salvus TaxID=3117733 RepID=UPI0039080DE0
MELVDRIARLRVAVERWLWRLYEGPILGVASHLVDRRVADEWFRGLYHGMISHPAYEKIEKEAEDVEDAFMLSCFPEAFGIPSPVSYYTAELLPYLGTEYRGWQRRMWNRESLLERKGQQYHF